VISHFNETPEFEEADRQTISQTDSDIIYRHRVSQVRYVHALNIKNNYYYYYYTVSQKKTRHLTLVDNFTKY